jgi:hypothetical protein
MLHKIYRTPGNEFENGGGDPEASATTPASAETSTRDYGKDIDGIRQEFGGFANEFRSFLSEYKQSKAPSSQSESQVPKEPKRSDYPATEQGIEKWIDDRAKFISQREYGELSKASAEQRKKDEAQVSQRKNLQQHFTRAADARKDYADFDTVIASPTVQVNDKIAEEILSSPISAHLQYAIWKNHADRFNVIAAFQESERAGIKALDRIEARIETELAAKKAAAKKTRFGATDSVEADVGSLSDEQENADLVKAYYKSKRK